MIGIFSPDPDSYGTYPAALSPSVEKPGKLENPQKGVTWAKQWTPGHIENHIRGAGLRFGMVPLHGDGTVRFMACDIDNYSGLDLAGLNKKLCNIHPMLFVLRSKSGGPHVYAFFKENVQVSAIKMKMREIISVIGIAGIHEYFPKQDSLDVANKEFANWINMPYYGAANDSTPPLQYAFNPSTGAALTLPEFIEHAQLRAGTLDEFLKIELKGNDLFADGPACFQRIYGEGQFTNRNVIMTNVIVYLRRKFPESWGMEAERYNNLMSDPLTATELAGIIKSNGRKEYGYNCNAEPLHSYCNRAACNLRKYGISSGHAFPFIQSLTKHDSDPPLWWIYFDNGKKMRCNTEELQSSKGFQARAMEQLNSVPPILKQENWTKMLQELMRNVQIVKVPENTTQTGMMKSYICDYLTQVGAGESLEDLLAHKPAVVDGFYYFQLSELMAWLGKKSFGLAKPEFITLVLGEMGAKFGTRTISKTSRHLYWIPVGSVEKHGEELPMPDLADAVNF